MAKPIETETPKRKRKGASVMVWLLMAMIIAGLGGFGVSNYGSGISNVGTVGTREIDVNKYARALQAEINAFGAQVGSPVTLQQAQALGLDQKVRQQLVTAAALDNEADRIGISVGDARVAKELASIPAFKGTSGSFDRETYAFTLKQNKLSEPEFETNLRDDLSRSLLQGAIVGGFAAPAALTDTLYNYVAERRGLTLLRLSEADLTTPVAAPTEDALKAHYDANIPKFTKPEARRITYAVLLPETLAGTMPVDEVELKKLYDARIDEFVQPEKRLVERLVFGTDDEAKAAKARLDGGETFEALVAERGLTMNDIDLGDLAPADLGAAGDAVFALKEPGVVGPLMSDLGPALFRMNGILAAQETPFAEARDSLVVEFQQDAARRAIGDKFEAIDDALAGGAALEDLVKEFGLSLGTIDFTDKSDEPIAGYTAFREAAATVTEGDFPQAISLDDGGLVALRLDEIVPAAPIPLADTKEAVTESWHAEALGKALAARAAEIKTAVDGGASLASFGILSVTPEIARDGFVENVPDSFMSTVFKMAAGETRVIEGPGFTGLVKLDSIQPAAATGDNATALKASIAAQAEQALAQDAFGMFASALSAEAGVHLDEAVINAVHAQFQ